MTPSPNTPVRDDFVYLVLSRLTRSRRRGHRSASAGQSFCLNTPQRSESKRSWLTPAVRFARMVRFGYLAFGYGLTKCATSKAGGHRSASAGQSFCLNTPQRSDSKRSWLKPAVRLAKMACFGHLAFGYGLNERRVFNYHTSQISRITDLNS